MLSASKSFLIILPSSSRISQNSIKKKLAKMPFTKQNHFHPHFPPGIFYFFPELGTRGTPWHWHPVNTWRVRHPGTPPTAANTTTTSTKTQTRKPLRHGGIFGPRPKRRPRKQVTLCGLGFLPARPARVPLQNRLEPLGMAPLPVGAVGEAARQKWKVLGELLLCVWMGRGRG